MKHFYVYCLYETLSDGTELPLYVGKGHDDTESGYSRMAHYLEPGAPRATRAVKEAIADKTWTVKKLADADDEIHAYALERKFVAEFGRRFLVNRTDGGSAGWTLSDESRLKMSITRTGKKLGPVTDEHRAHLIAGARRRAADPAWRAAHSARMTGRVPTAAQIAAVKAALTGKPHANRATKKVQSAALAAKHRAVLLPYEGSGIPLATIFEKVKTELGLSHISALYRAADRAGVSLRTLADLSALTAEEKRQRRLDVYKRGYEKHKAERQTKAITRAAGHRQKVKAARSALVSPPVNATCHQRTIRDNTKTEDLLRLEPLLGDLSALKASQFVLAQEPYAQCHRDFIKRYEWLGNPGISIKWCFTARFNSELGGVVLLSEPYHPSELEALIARGACAGWTPKNLGSRMVMFACRWMAENTQKRKFVAYADEEAGEVGQIYQACNFRFLGWKNVKYGVKADGGRISFQTFKRTSRMMPWLKSRGIELPASCFTAKGFLHWSAIPQETKSAMYAYIAAQKAEISTVAIRRGKYVMVQGATPAETRRLNSGFTAPTFPYPKRAAMPPTDPPSSPVCVPTHPCPQHLLTS